MVSWVIIYCLSVSCTKINNSCCALMVWSSLQLTYKQWIITQQFTARADLFLNNSQFLKLRRSIRAQHRKLEYSKFENEMSSDAAYCHCFTALSVSQWMNSWSAHLFSVCVKWNSVFIGHLFDQFNFLYKHLFVYSYTAKFVLDLLEIRKSRFSYDEAHMSKVIQWYYAYFWHEQYWSQFTQFTFILQE